MRRIAKLSLALLALLACGPAVRAQISVVTTDTILADLARRVGGDQVKVESLSRGVDDPHHVDPRPSMVLKVARAKVVCRIGMDLDIWLDPILDKAGNAQVSPGGKGYCDCSKNIRPLEIPEGKLDPSMGDLHVYGNPHYLMDPVRSVAAAGEIAAVLIRVDPSNQPFYHQRFEDYGAEVKRRMGKWSAALAPFKGSKITVYHKTWVYFLSRFGLAEFDAVEPKPGIAPSIGHVSGLVKRMKAENIRAVLSETFRSRRFPEMISRETGARAVFVPVSVDAEPGVGDYLTLMDVMVDRLAAGLKGE